MILRVLLPALLLTACATTPRPPQAQAPAPILTTPDAIDTHSFARPAEARVRHVSLDLVADFEAKAMRGTATLDVIAAPGAREIVLDSKGLRVSGVTDGKGRALPFAFGARDAIKGQPLAIQLGGANRVVVTYQSAPQAAALQWLAPAQTAGKQQPFLFSQGQAILNRSWIPTQDSPGIRQTWDARITVPDDLVAVMSADQLTQEGEATANGRVFRFAMDKPVAPYLIALAVGDLAFKPLGPRTGVWSEPAMLDASASEFADLERMMTTAESLYGPYRWGRYDLLVLPPAFPFGGMENPKLTFVTPTVIAGDRSLVSLIAHELAHSWSGNLVTNASWNDFWLNEGFTVYFENRIMEALYGKERAAMLADLGWSDMQAAIVTAGGMAAPDTRLKLDLTGRDPDDGLTDIAYEKGATFLRTIESVVGRARFDAWLKSYFERFAFQPQTSSGFVADLRANLLRGDEDAQIGVTNWIEQPGLPANAVHIESATFAAVDRAAGVFAGGEPLSAVVTRGWTTPHYLRFLNALPRALRPSALQQLDRDWGLSNAGNSEIRFAWLQLAIANRHPSALASAERFLLSMGRRKFVAPLFASLWAQGEWGRGPARAIYAKARPGYHAVTTQTVDKTLEWPAG